MTKIQLNKFGYLIIAIGLLLFYTNYPFFQRSNWLNSQNEEVKIQEWHHENTEDKFCIWFDYTRRTFEPENTTLALTTHGSVSHSKFIFEHASRWNGPISVAYYLEPNALTALAAYKKLYHCTKETKKFVSTHLVWKKSLLTPCDSSFVTSFLFAIDDDEFPNSCDFYQYEHLFQVPLQSIYPINSLRNIARAGSRSEFQMVSDIENYFSDNAYNVLKQATATVPENKAVIVRRFEFAENETIPSSFKQLQIFLKEKKAVQFHLKVYTAGHWIPGLNQWLKYSINASNTPRLEFARYPGPAWEPHLLIRSSYPYHRESYYVRVNDQQPFVYEICRANISFTVASHVFTLHRGIKTHTTAEQIQQRNLLREKAAKAAEVFRDYLNEKYPFTKEKCGKCRTPCGIL